MLLGITGAVILSRSSLVTPYFGLDIHSFILAILATLVGFQLAVFGVAASLYSIETGHQPGQWVKTVVSAPVRLGAAGIGVLIILFSFIALISMIIGWLVSGAGSFNDTRDFVMATTALVGGMQLLSDVLFISIFAVSAKKKLRTSTRNI